MCVTGMNGGDARTTCCMSSATTAAAVDSDTSTASAAVRLHRSTSYMPDADDVNRDVLVTDNASNSTDVSAASSAHLNTVSELCTTTVDTTGRQSSTSLATLTDARMSPATEAANSVLSSSVSEPTAVGSPFRFSVAGYDFQKYTNMVIIVGLIQQFL